MSNAATCRRMTVGWRVSTKSYVKPRFVRPKMRTECLSASFLAAHGAFRLATHGPRKGDCVMRVRHIGGRLTSNVTQPGHPARTRFDPCADPLRSADGPAWHLCN